jgi:hypothetical protein
LTLPILRFLQIVDAAAEHLPDRDLIRLDGIAGHCAGDSIALFTLTLRGDQSGNKPYKK